MKKYNLIKKIAAVSCATLLSFVGIPTAPVNAVGSMPDFSYLGAVGVLTEEQTIVVAESFYQAMLQHSTVAEFNFPSGSEEIVMSNDAMESVQLVYDIITHEYEVGILAVKGVIQDGLRYGQSNSRKSSKQTVYLVAAQFSYYVEDEDYDATYKTLTGQLDEISALVLDEWSDVEKALFLHDYLAYHYDFDNTEYDTTIEKVISHTAYGMLSRNMGVCEGYASLYNMLLNREGIESHLMTSDKLGHAWNVVKIGNEWLHVDVTWDDAFNTHVGVVQHDSFLKNADDMRKSGHEHDDWRTLTHVLESDMNISADSPNGFWTGSNAVIQYKDGQWFAVTPTEKNTNTVEYCWYNYDPITNTAEKTSLTSDTRYWLTPEGDVAYAMNFSIPAFYQDVILYSTPTSVFYINGNQPYWLFDLTSEQKEQGYIYGLHVEGDTLYYGVSASPLDAVVEYSIDLNQYDDSMFTTSVTSETTTTTTTQSTTTTTTTTKPTTSTTTTTTTTKPTTTTTATTTKPTTTTTTTTTTTQPTTTTTTTTTQPTTSTTTTTTEPPVLLGDVDGDDVLTVSDVILLQRYLHRIDSFTENQFALADFNYDGAVNVIDLALLKRCLISG